MKTAQFCTRNWRICTGVGRNNISCEYLLFEMALGSMKTPSFAHEIEESAQGIVFLQYLLFEMALGIHENFQVLHTNLENLHWQGWAGII